MLSAKSQLYTIYLKLTHSFFSILTIKLFWLFERTLAAIVQPILLDTRNIHYSTHFLATFLLGLNKLLQTFGML